MKPCSTSLGCDDVAQVRDPLALIDVLEDHGDEVRAAHADHEEQQRQDRRDDHRRDDPRQHEVLDAG